jgi:hypothetical protein
MPVQFMRALVVYMCGFPFVCGAHRLCHRRLSLAHCCVVHSLTTFDSTHHPPRSLSADAAPQAKTHLSAVLSDLRITAPVDTSLAAYLDKLSADGGIVDDDHKARAARPPSPLGLFSKCVHRQLNVESCMLHAA